MTIINCGHHLMASRLVYKQFGSKAGILAPIGCSHHQRRHMFWRKWMQDRDPEVRLNPERRKKKVVMFPDIPKDTAENNVLLRLPKDGSLPAFSQMEKDKCFRAVWKLNIFYDACIDNIEADLEDGVQKSVQDVLADIENHLVPLDYAFRNFLTLYYANHTKYKFNNMAKLFVTVSKTRQRRYTSRNLYHFLKKANQESKENLTDIQKRVIDNYLTGGKVQGMDITDVKAREQFESLLENLMDHIQAYRWNVDEASKRFAHVIRDSELLRSLPDNLVATMASQRPSIPGPEQISDNSDDSYIVNFNPIVYGPFMEYCSDRILRCNLHQAYNLRASHQNDRLTSNSVVIEEIRTNRHRQAELLGFPNFAELSASTKMAGSGETIKTFIKTLHVQNKPVAEQRLKELAEFARKSGAFGPSDKIELYDIAYWKRKYLISKFNIQEDQLRHYFPLPTVLSGIYKLCERLFDVRIEEIPQDGGKLVDTWHPDVKVLKILNNRGHEAATIYFDPYTRPSDKIVTGKPILQCPLAYSQISKTKPLCYLLANLPRPLTPSTPPMLMLGDVLSLFREFGQILRHSLSHVEYAELSGLNGVEWDTAQMCPDFMAMWAIFDYQTIKDCTAHTENGSPMSEEAHTNLRKAFTYFSSVSLMEELYRMALDIALYECKRPFWGEIQKDIWNEFMSPFTPEKHDAMLCSFRQIFCDEYAANYYSIKWSEMLAADCFAAFTENGLHNEELIKTTGHRFRDTFLVSGGSCKGMELFRRFRGRDPSPDALLALYGIRKDDTNEEQLTGEPRVSKESSA